MKKVVLCTGGFDPLHSGHIAYFKEAKLLGDKLIVGVNSDEWLKRKKGQPFMPMRERVEIIKNLSMVDSVCPVLNDDHLDDAGGAIFHVLATHGDIDLIFANGGDRQPGNVPEEEKWSDCPNVKFVYGVGGEDKKNSSSWILKEWTQPSVKRKWGEYTVLEKGDGWQVKKLTFEKEQSLSDQRHFKRSEHWHIVEGEIQIYLEYPEGFDEVWTGKAGDSFNIPPLTWHKAVNIGESKARVVEVWMGTELSEDVIERRD